MNISILILTVSSYTVLGNLVNIPERSPEEKRTDMIVKMIFINLKNNGWNTVLCHGYLPDDFYLKIQPISYAFTLLDDYEPQDDDNDERMKIHYYSNFIIINCQDFKGYEESLLKLMKSFNWHPLANIIVYYHKEEERETIAKIFFILWFYKAINTIIVQYNDSEQTLFISDYTPYVTTATSVDHQFGCWTSRVIGMPIFGFDEGFTCEKECLNVTLHSKLRAENLGTCIGFNKKAVSYNAIDELQHINLFYDKSKNLNGFKFRAYATEVEPFFTIGVHENGTNTIHSRDGVIWNTMSQLMNFGIDLSPSVDVMKKPFDFELNIEQIFAFSRRRGDIYLIPIYIFDIIVVDIDFTVPFKESGVCILSYRAGFKTTMFDTKSLETNYNMIVLFLACFISIWITFSVFKGVENGRLTSDQIGKDLMNTFRNILSVNLHKPPKRQSFRIFMSVSIWCFFVLNFSNQATIISFFTAVKRGKEVETFEDVIEKGYVIEGMASPDLFLPDTENKFKIINQRLVAERDIFGCVRRMSNDSHRFCLIDCAIGHYVQRNRLNEKGEQYLHIAKDRMHSHYLNMILPKHSPITERFNKYMMTFVEAGLVKKWEQYRYTDIKQEVSVKPLGMGQLYGIFQLYCLLIGFTIIIFILELIIYHTKKFGTNCLKSNQH